MKPSKDRWFEVYMGAPAWAIVVSVLTITAIITLRAIEVGF